MKAKPKTLTEQELPIMKVIWELGTATVREVYEELRKERSVAYTTVMTMMNILESKGHLVKRPVGRAYLYQPVQAKGKTIAGLVDDFVERVFDGAATPLVLSLIRDRKLSEQELEEISRLIAETPEEPR